jgi:hypothetical protein
METNWCYLEASIYVPSFEDSHRYNHQELRIATVHFWRVKNHAMPVQSNLHLK